MFESALLESEAAEGTRSQTWAWAWAGKLYIDRGRLGANVKLAFRVLLIVLCLVIVDTGVDAKRIKLLATGNVGLLDAVERFFRVEPLVVWVPVPSRDERLLRQDDLLKLIRLYFPRTLEEMKTFDFIMLAQPEYNLFTPKQDQWMYEAIKEGTGGINDGSVFSIVAQIHLAWANSLTAKAFPNDAQAVAARGAGEAGSLYYRVIINRDFPDPVLTPYVLYGVEQVSCIAASRMVIPREAAGLMAWQEGNFPVLGKVPYIAVWDYEKGRTITTGDFMGNGWFAYPTSPSANQYSPDILMNMIFYCTTRKLIDDAEVFHRVKSNFAEYKSRMAVLISLKDFIDKFGANTLKLEEEMRRLEGMYAMAAADYLDQEFVASEGKILSALNQFPQAEEMARREKNAALIWVYVVEWLVTSSTLFLSGSLLWALMIRRKMYRMVKSTRLG